MMTISVIIPCRDESRFIRKCLDSVVAQDYSKAKMEVLVVDGGSMDSTEQTIKEYSVKHPFIKLLHNPKKITPCAFNIGIQSSRGEFIAILGAHSEYPPNFLSTALEKLLLTKADVVGGPVVTLPGANTITAKGIALVTSHPFGVGNSSFRTSVKEGYVDTVPFGIFRREIFDKLGYFDERLARNQDNEFSSRIIKNGGKIFLTPSLAVKYYNQATLAGFAKHAFKTGSWNVMTLYVNPSAFRWRHFMPFIFISALLITGVLFPVQNWARFIFLGLIGLYGAFAVLSSIHIGMKNKVKFFGLLPIFFFIYHASYGLGTLAGIFQLLIRNVRNIQRGNGQYESNTCSRQIF